MLKTVQRWREANEQNAARLSDEVFATLQERVPALIRDVPAVERGQKAERLKKVLGNELEALEIICDVRPVYDDSRERIEGLIPVQPEPHECGHQPSPVPGSPGWHAFIVQS